ncbi:MAG TPA: hypothetical protein VFE14_02515 [Micromonosporaceae bacterium]|nr:hypothetical protein [Micromonosporaceae bacterium]
MIVRKALVATVALATSLLFVAGCQKDSTTPSAGPSAAVKPVDELIAAAAKLNTASYKYDMKAGEAAIKGAVDPATKSVKLSLTATTQGVSLNIDVLAIGTDFYAKIAGLPLPGLDSSKWLHLDGTKVKSLESLGVSNLSDPTSAEQLGKQFVTVERNGDRGYKGTLDLTKGVSMGADKDAIAKLGDKAKAVPFEATVDSQGRLATLKFTVPAVGSDKETTVDVTYSDFGASVDLAKPAAADVVEAPASIYQMLGG